MEKKNFKYTRSGCDFVCQYKELTIIVDESSLWEYALHNGYNEWAVDGFDPNSMYGHTQKCGSLDMEDYLNDGDKTSVLMELIEYTINP